MKRSALSDRDAESLAYFWLVLWAAVVLNPRANRGLIAAMRDFGLVKRPFGLTPQGKRIIAFVQSPDRPRYPARRKTAKKAKQP